MKQKYRKIYGLLVVIAFLLYGNTIKNEYALDDDFVVGPHSPTALGIKGIPKILKSYHVKDESGNEYEYRPMVKISYALEVSLFGTNVHLHHLFNVLYYALSLIVLFHALLLLFENFSMQSILWMVILFAFIPLHSEVVASLKNRDVLLSFIFSMLVLINFLKWIKNTQWLYLMLSAVCFFLALASKFDALPLMAILPLVYIQKQRLKNQNISFVKWIGSIFLIVLLLFAMYVFLKKGQKLLLDPALKQRVFNYFENPLYYDKSLKYRIFTMFNTMGFYVWMLLFPFKMSCYYGYNVISVYQIEPLFGTMGIVSVGALIYLFFQRFQKADLLWYGVVFFGINISMFLNVVKPVPGIVADRFAFAPSVGWVMMLFYSVEYLHAKYVDKKQRMNVAQINWWNSGKLKTLLMTYLLLQSVLIWYRNYEWRYKLFLYEADVKKYPEAVKLHILYGSQIIIEYLQNSGKLPAYDMPRYLDIALNEFKQGILTDSTCGSCYNNVAYLYMNWKRDYAGSIPYLLKSYQLDSTRKEMLTNIAISYLKTGRNKDTVELFIQKAIKADKDKTYEIPYEVMKEYCKLEKQYQKGIQFFEEQLKERPYSEYLYVGLAELQVLNGDTAQAIKTYERLLELNPNCPQVASYLAVLKEKKK